MLWTYGSATFQATWRIGSEGELLHLCCSCSLGCWPRCNLIPHSSSSGFVPKKQWSRLALKGLSEEVRALGLAFDNQARSSNHQILCWNRSASSAQVCPLISSGCTRELHLLSREHEVDLELWWGAFILRTVPRTVCNLVSPASPKFVRLKSPRYR